MPSSTTKELRDGTITESNIKSTRREIRFFYSTPESNFLVKENYEANGKDRTPSSILRPMARSPSRTMTVTSLKLTINL